MGRQSCSPEELAFAGADVRESSFINLPIYQSFHSLSSFPAKNPASRKMTGDQLWKGGIHFLLAFWLRHKYLYDVTAAGSEAFTDGFPE
jgi:hypothetical protein